MIKSRQQFVDEFKVILRDQFGENAVDTNVSNDLAVQLQALATVAESVNFSLDMLLDETSFLTSQDQQLLRNKAEALQVGISGATPMVGGLTVTYSGTSLSITGFTIPKNTAFTIDGVDYITISDVIVPSVQNRSYYVIKLPVRQVSASVSTVLIPYSTINNNEIVLEERVVADTIDLRIENAVNPFTQRKSLLNADEKSYIVNTRQDGKVSIKLNGDFSLNTNFQVNYRVTQGANASTPTGDSVVDIANVLPQPQYITYSIDDFFSRGKNAPTIEDIRNNILSELNNANRAASGRDIMALHLAEDNVSAVAIDNIDGYTFHIFCNDGSNTTVSDAYLNAVKASISSQYNISLYQLNYFPLGFCIPRFYISLNTFTDVSRLRQSIYDNLKLVIDGKTEIYLSDLYQAIESITDVQNSFITNPEIIPYVRKVVGGANSNLAVSNINTIDSTHRQPIVMTVNASGTNTLNIFEDGVFRDSITVGQNGDNSFFSSRYDYSLNFDPTSSVVAGDVFSFIVYPQLNTSSVVRLNEYSVFYFDQNQITIN